MSSDIRLFPYLTEDLMNRIRLQSRQYCFYYEKDNEEQELVEESLDAGASFYAVKDEKGIWTPDDYNLCFRRQICLRTFQCLFGPEGIACRNATLGLAVIWKSADSKQRGAIPAGTFNIKDSILETTVEKRFARGQLRGKVEFSTVLYIVREGRPKRDEKHLANEQGFILGELEKHIIKLDGAGSTFPVFEVSEKGQPLWYVKCDWYDPAVDSFSDSVSINLNTAHKNYKYIDRNQSSYNPQLLAEVMAGALTVIVEKVRLQPEAWEQIMSNDNLERGSIGEAIHYFAETLGWDLSSPDKVSLCARKFFDQRM